MFNFLCFFSFFQDFIYLFLERGREGEKEGNKHQCVAASHVARTGDVACNPGMYLDWELNQWPFGSQAGTQSTEPHKPGLFSLSLKYIRLKMYSVNPMFKSQLKLFLCVVILPILHAFRFAYFSLYSILDFTVSLYIF